MYQLNYPTFTVALDVIIANETVDTLPKWNAFMDKEESFHKMINFDVKWGGSELDSFIFNLSYAIYYLILSSIFFHL